MKKFQIRVLIIAVISITFGIGYFVSYKSPEKNEMTESVSEIAETANSEIDETGESQIPTKEIPTEDKKPALKNDFNPPDGSSEGPGELGLWGNRLMSASSKDGINWEKTGEVITDQGDVPDLAYVDGTLYLYYTGWTVGESKNRTVVAVSNDNSETWAYKYLTITGMEKMASPVDPDIQYVDDVFRLYLTSDPNDGNGPRTYYLESTDGFNFEKKGVAFSQSKKMVLDPNTILIGDTWHFFAGGEPSGNWHATSSDGKTFTLYAKEKFLENGIPHMMSNGIQMGDVYRYYAFSNDSTDIVSFKTKDGYDWTYEGTTLALDESSGLESKHLKDATVIELDDGTYYMVYVTKIP